MWRELLRQGLVLSLFVYVIFGLPTIQNAFDGGELKGRRDGEKNFYSRWGLIEEAIPKFTHSNWALSSPVLIVLIEKGEYAILFASSLLYLSYVTNPDKSFYFMMFFDKIFSVGRCMDGSLKCSMICSQMYAIVSIYVNYYSSYSAILVT